jgi:hypothetical protein
MPATSGETDREAAEVIPAGEEAVLEEAVGTEVGA